MTTLALLLLLAAPPASPAAPDAAAILARARAAQGGAAWDGVRSLRLTGTVSSGGLQGPFSSVTDVRSGRFRDTWKLGALEGANGFDGRQAWSQDGSGQSRVDDGETPHRTAVTEAYRRAQAWWYPGRRAGEIRALDDRSEGARRFHVLAITPAGGRSFELWVDAATGLFDRTVEHVGVDTMVTTLSDWRDVGGVKVPFLVRAARAGDEGAHDLVLTASRAERDVAVDDARFARPGPPPRDFGIAGGRTSTTVPFTVVNGHVYVDVNLDGRGPYRLLLDSGGSNIVTPAVARELGLAFSGALPVSGAGEKVEETGATRIDRVEIGDAFLERQPFFVYAIDATAHVEGVPQMGLVGYELLRRFVARIDYEHRQLTLYEPAAFRYEGPGAAVPFAFNDHIPQVKGEIDGLPGAFDLDTGARSSLVLTTAFATRHGLYEKMHAGPERIQGWGVGGPSRERPARARVLKLGPVEIPSPVTLLSTSRRGLADPDQAGNVGYGVLSRFTVIFDYGHQQVILEKNGLFGRPDPFDRSGLWVNAADDGWEVVEVVPTTPAAEAGVAAGDRIVAVDGKTSPALSLPDSRAKLRDSPPGTRVELRLRRGGAERTVALVLRDLI